ncbi:hypothetical protein ACHAW6_007113 [Cyclotella cf. meneghiniana]
MKGRACANGRPQPKEFDKQDTTSPMIAKEKDDIPDTFFHTEMDENVIMMLRGRLAELMFPEEITQIWTTPVAGYLFRVRDDAMKLPEKQAQFFHQFVANLVFVQARARHDLAIATAILMTCIKLLDQDDWGKLCHVMQYMNGTINIPLVLLAESMMMPKW